MKKFLLFLLLITFSFVNAQINTQVSNYNVCDTNSDGIAQFDLNTKIPEILGNENPSIHNISFHTTNTDAQFGSNPIVTSVPYVNNQPFSQFIWIRVVNTQTSQLWVSQLNLVVNLPANAGSDGSTTVCETSATVINLFALITGEQPGGTWTRTSGSGGTFNSLSGTYTPAVGATTSTFAYTLSGTAPCIDDTSVATVFINNQPDAGSDGSITACDAFTNVINLFALITGEQPGGTWTRIAGTGGVFYAAAGTYTPEYGATTSTFTYTLTGTAPCINDTSIATVNLNHQPNAGLDGSITICDTSMTTIDLYSLITNEELGGTWIRTTGTGGTFSTVTGTFTPSPNSTTSTFIYIINGTAPCINDSSEAIVIINSCGPNSCLPPSNLSFTNIFDTGAVLGWNEVGTATSWEVYIVPFGAPAPTAAISGIVVASQLYFVTGLTPSTCYVYYVRSICGPNAFSAWSLAASFCTTSCANNGQCADNITLVAFVDSNNDGIKDLNENVFTNGSFVYDLNNSGTPSYGNANNGSFLIFDNNPANTYNLSFTVNSNFATYYNSSINYSNITIPAGSGSTTYYFPVTQIQSYNDLKVSIIPIGQPRPGFSYANVVRFKNNGTQTINGTITYEKDVLVTITSISQTGTLSNSNGFTYNFTNLLPNEEQSIVVTLQVPTIPTINLGDLITNSVGIIPLTGDIFPYDNQMSLSQIVVGSYDPNDKTETHGGKIDIDDFTSNDYLTYTIQFENTGTANAEFVRVEDFLDASLNPSSIEMLGSSHAYNMRRIGNQLIWNFYNINLPPTSINPTGSHGFIQFKIKPTAGFALGDIIPNKAFIYFDYNPPIITNEFQTEFVQSLKTTDFDSSNFVLYPNPTNSNINVSLLNSSEAINTIEIHDLLGKKIKEVLNSSSNDVNIDVSDLSKGIYLVQITTQSDLKITKKLIIQ